MAVVPFPDPQGSRDPSPPNSDLDRWDDTESDAAGKMSFLDHLDELRKRIVHSLLALVGGVLVTCLFINRIFEFIMRPLQQMLPAGGKLIYTDPPEAFMLYVKIAIMAGLIVAAPFIMWQVWRFVAPALYANEKRFALPFVALSSLGFFMGAAFSHYVVFPMMWKFFGSFSSDFVSFTPKLEPVFDLYAKMLLSMAFVFQMPSVVFFLAKMGVVTARWMLRHFKYAVLAIFVVAAIITPSADMASQIIVATPMITLYLLSIVIAWVFGKRKPKVTVTV